MGCEEAGLRDVLLCVSELASGMRGRRSEGQTYCGRRVRPRQGRFEPSGLEQREGEPLAWSAGGSGREPPTKNEYCA